MTERVQTHGLEGACCCCCCWWGRHAHTTHHISNVPGVCVATRQQFFLNTPPNNNNNAVMPSGPPRSALYERTCTVQCTTTAADHCEEGEWEDIAPTASRKQLSCGHATAPTPTTHYGTKVRAGASAVRADSVYRRLAGDVLLLHNTGVRSAALETAACTAAMTNQSESLPTPPPGHPSRSRSTWYKAAGTQSTTTRTRKTYAEAVILNC